jgi:hypothetical protein
MTKVRKGPNCASIGLAHDAFVGVKHSSTFSRLAQRRIAGVLFAARLSMITNSRYPPGRAARTDLSAARVWPPPLCSRVTPCSWSSPMP